MVAEEVGACRSMIIFATIAEKSLAVFFSFKELEAKPTVKCPHCQSNQIKKLITGFFAKTSKKSIYRFDLE